ncbi:MAG: hypothetical protein AB1746_12100 [Candidatus Zixiibacteriota bacterium]
MMYRRGKIFILLAGLLFGAIIIVFAAGCSSDSQEKPKQEFGLIPLKKDCFGKVVRFAVPESFIFDEICKSYFISNINGDPLVADDNGYIIKLDSNFKLIDNYFIDGRSDQILLNAPKGLAVFDSVLYVTDINVVRTFDAYTGQPLPLIDFSAFNPEFLNDIAADTIGNLYVSDMFTDRIFKINRAGAISVLASLEAPNGLLWTEGDFLLAACWSPPRIAKIAADGMVQDILTDSNFLQLDGIDIDKLGRLYFSDYRKGAIYRYNLHDRLLETVLTGMKSPADISIDRKNNLLLIPDFSGSCCVYKLN